MKKPFLYLILVWSLISASGLAAFLFEIYGPASIPAASDESINPAVAVVFWGIMWLIPVVVLTIAGRRRKG